LLATFLVLALDEITNNYALHDERLRLAPLVGRGFITRER